MFEFFSNNALYSANLLFIMFFYLYLLLITEIDIISNQSGVAYRKACNCVFHSSELEEMTFPHKLIFVFTPYFCVAIRIGRFAV